LRWNTVWSSPAAHPERGTFLTDFTLDASGTTSNVQGVTYRWDWDGDGAWDTDWLSASSVRHRYADGDTFRVVMEAKVGEASGRDTVEVTLDNEHGALRESFPIPPEHPRGVAFDGSAFWIADWGAPGTHSLYKVAAGTGAPLDTLPAPRTWPGGLVWDGSALWVADALDGPHLFRIDPVSGEILERFPVVYSASGGGLAWTGESFFFGSEPNGDEGDGDIHHYARDGSHLGSFRSPRGSTEPAGLAYDGVNLLVTIQGSDSLYAVSPVDGGTRWVNHMGRGIGFFTLVDGYIWMVYRDGGLRLGRVVP
jgi:hypothetical protein